MTEPTVEQELEDRAGDRDRLAAYFRQHPSAWLDQAPIAAALGIGEGSLRSRKCECKNLLHMNIETRNTKFVGSDGKVHRGLKQWRYLPYVPLWRSADVPTVPLVEKDGQMVLRIGRL